MEHDKLRTLALSKRKVREEFEALAPEYALFRDMLKAREREGLSQVEVADRMGTKGPSVARLERSLAMGRHSPSVHTLRRYARAVNCRLEVRLVRSPHP
jgi:ribosome-binding protein aMBF1 (putative translation factor)